MFRRLLATTGCMIMLSGVFVVQAGAVQPVTVTDSVTFTETNPCTGQEHQVSLNFVAKVIENKQNFVVIGKTTGSTSDGYIVSGGDSFVMNAGGDRGAVNLQARGPDGEKFRVTGNFAFNANQGELKFDRLSVTCIGS